MKILLTLAVTCAAIFPVKTNAQTPKVVPSGLYEIVPKSTISFKHPESGKVIYLEPKTAVTLKMCASLSKDYNVNDVSPEIVVQLDSAGTIALKKLSTRLVGKEVAIVAGNQLQSTPRIISAVTNGSFTISNRFNNTECDRLKAQLEQELMGTKVKPMYTGH